MDMATRVKELTERYGRLEGAALLAATHQALDGRIALVSSFGAESAVLLAMAAEAAPDFPVILVNTGKLFGETLRYRDQLVKRLGLTNLREVGPTAEDLAVGDPNGLLFSKNHDSCCHLRKTIPLDRALAGFDGWITGRKRFQAATRAALSLFEAEGDKIKVNPLAAWDKARLEEEFIRRDLPRHPLEADGFLSIGCYTCTERVAPGADLRSGRWAGTDKTECGIHMTMIGTAR